jgi:hypothetical protein
MCDFSKIEYNFSVAKTFIKAKMTDKAKHASLDLNIFHICTLNEAASDIAQLKLHKLKRYIKLNY